MENKTLSTISINHKAFVDESGNRFMVRGVALSPNSNVDLLQDSYSDYMEKYVIPQLIKLNVNVIRVYQIDQTKSHDTVMQMLANNNIYVMVGMVTPDVSVNRMAPEYTLALYNRITTIADEFCGYSNTFAFSVGNEVVFPGEIYNKTGNDATKANQIIKEIAGVMKSMIRDVKKYMSNNNLRAVPTGMAMQDGASPTVASWGGIGTDVVAEYYTCGDQTNRADFIGINTYRYVNDASPGPMNSYDGLATEVANIPVPVFLTESGGVKKPFERDWKIVTQVYKEQLLYHNLSGQIAFQFFNKRENLGLYTETPIASENPITGTINPLPKTVIGGADNLSSEYSTSSGISVDMPATVTDPSPCSIDFNPAMLPSPAATINITIENYAGVKLKAVQEGVPIADLSPGSKDLPSSTTVMVNASSDLLIQQKQSPTDWTPVCRVSADNLVDGLVVKNNVAWGNGVACNIS